MRVFRRNSAEESFAIGSNLLKSLFGNVLIPKAVDNELIRFHKRIPSFLRTEQIHDLELVTELIPPLDIGEAEAIVLAKELRVDYLSIIPPTLIFQM